MMVFAAIRRLCTTRLWSAATYGVSAGHRMFSGWLSGAPQLWRSGWAPGGKV